MSGALLFLLWRSARGRVLRALRRLREPRYLVGFIVGGGWVVFWMSRFAFRGDGDFDVQMGLPPEALDAMAGALGSAVQLAACAIILIGLGIWWFVPFGKHALELSEAELHLLLPAPLPRRQIFEYAILRSQGGVLVGVAIVTFFSGARGPLEILGRFAAFWVFFTIWDLHAKGRALWLAGLDELPGASAWRRRALVWGSILLSWALLAIGIAQVLNAVLLELPAIQNDVEFWLRDALPGHVEAARAGVLGWLLTPLLWLTAPVFVGIGGDTGLVNVAVAWLVPILFLVLHNEWVVRSQGRFEEAALDRARRKSRKADPAARFWRSSRRNRARSPFALGPTGSPAVAVLWKNLILSQRLPLRTLLGAGAALVALGLLAVTTVLPAWSYGALQIVGGAALLIPPLLSGRSMRNDLRTDLLKIETIRPWPLAGSRLMAAEIAAPVLLVMLQVLLGAGLVIGLDLVDTLGLAPYELTVKQRLGEFFSAPPAMIVPLAVLAYLPVALVVAALSSCLENVAALMFPSWVHLGLNKKQAAAKFGQNLIIFFALSIAMLFGLAPGFLAVGAAVAIQTLLWGLSVTAWELPLLGVIGAAPVGAVVVALIGAGGRLWERLDPSEELLAGRV